MAKTTACVRDRKGLSPADEAQMYALYEAYYEATSPQIFAADLAGKSHVFELRDAGRLCGFSTLEVIELELEGAAHRALFSGDTIIRHEYWGEQTLAAAFCELAGRLKGARPEVPLYWLLISKGYRTYRYLNLFSRDYYPSCRAPTPPAAQRRLDALARHKFGAAYDARLGLVRFPCSRGQLRTPWAQIRDNLRERPEVRFFLERNPRFAQGEELVCLAELSVANLRGHARRAFQCGLAAAGELRDAA
jgi:hypothetical protein